MTHKFDVLRSAKRRAILRLVIRSVFSIGLILWGLYLLPENPDWTFAPRTLEAWDGWGFVGLIMLGSGIFGLFKEAVFGTKSLGQTGHWHFLLADGHLTWDVPNHAHGEEEGFRSALSEISSIEYRTIQRYEQMDVCEYWLHFHEGDPIQLKSYSGISLSWIASRIQDAGVEYRETIIER